MRMNDREKGTSRGRSRNFVGRIKWLVVAMLLLNIFFMLKLWAKSNELSEEKRSSEGANIAITSVRYEYAKCDKRNAELLKELQENGRQLRDIRVDLAEFKDRSQECESRAAAIGAERMTLYDQTHRMNKEKEHLQQLKDTLTKELRTCAMQLRGKKTQIRLERNENADKSAKIMFSSVSLKRTNQPKMQDLDNAKEANAAPVLNEIKAATSHRNVLNEGRTISANSALDETEEIQDVDDIRKTKKIICVLDQGKAMIGACKFKNDDSLSSVWEQKASMMIDSNLNPDEVPDSYLAVVESDDRSPMEAAFTLSGITSTECIEMELRVWLQDTGMIAVFDDGKEIAMFKSEGKRAWEVNSMILEKPRTVGDHLVTIKGMVPSAGAVAISKLAMFAVPCPQVTEAVKKNGEGAQVGLPPALQPSVVHADEDVSRLDDAGLQLEPDEDEGGMMEMEKETDDINI